jgi:putative transposase
MAAVLPSAGAHRCWRVTPSPSTPSCCAGMCLLRPRGQDAPGLHPWRHAAPTGQWVTQQARNLLIELGERAEAFRFLVRDRGSFTASFDAVLTDAGTEILRSPPRALKANAYAERWIGALRRECLDRSPIFSERQLSSVLAEYVTHYDGHRPRRSLDQRPPLPGAGLIRGQDTSLAVQRTDILGGLIHEYRQAA